MKKKYIYALLFGIPGLFVAGIVSILVFGAFTGILWMFVFGDNPWPDYIEWLVAIVFVLTVLSVWVVSIALGYVVGRRLENNPGLNRTHVLISAGLSVLFLVLILFQQWSVGNLGPKSDSTACSDFCSLHGYSGSGMPPRNSGEKICSCFDEAGNEVLRIPLDHLDPDFPR
jgi:hypothetical protein